jgi:membrane protease subunit HflK
MPWKGQGGGSQGGGPWGGGNGQGPWGKGPGSPRPPGGPTPPNLEDLIRRGQEGLRRLIPGGGSGMVLGLALVVLLVLWLATGIYRVGPDELGVVLRFGAYQETTLPGLHYHLPIPIEHALTPKVTVVNRTEVGLAGDLGGRNTNRQEVPEEALMLTGDENIVDINLSVLWVVDAKRVQDYLFNIRNPEQTVKSVAEAAIREIVGRTPIASVLAEGRGKVETDTRDLIQSILDSYGAGILVQQVQLQKVNQPAEVIASVLDVQQALTDRDTAQNKAEAYHNDVVPRARGQAAQITQAAEAFKQQVVAQASGDAQRFLAVMNAYHAAKDVTATRLYLETMEQILSKANKVVIDKSAAGVVPYLPLPGLAGAQAEPPSLPAQPQGRASR